MRVVLVLGLLLNLIALPIAIRRVIFLTRLITHGQPAPDRLHTAGDRIATAAKSELTEVFGQRRLLKWTAPGMAHFTIFWAFMILSTVYIEAYGALFKSDFEIPIIGHWRILGFAQDTIALIALGGLTVFGIIRWSNSPAKLGRQSRFKGSHNTGAWLVLFLILMVIATMFLYRGAASALGNYTNEGAYASQALGRWMSGWGTNTLEFLEGLGLLLHIGVMLGFLIEVVHSKHLHIFAGPINVAFKRTPIALGAAQPLMVAGKPVTMEDLEEMEEEPTLGVGKVEDFTWKGLLDFATCTECGRCQSQCPAWNTEKPLSPKLLIMGLRDHAYAKGPWLLAADEAARENLPDAAKAAAERPLVGETEGEAYAPTGGAVIDPDVLWSCVTCGACVQQCPVDIEHVDHIIEMRRYQTLVESAFPNELAGLFRNMENKGDPWGMGARARLDWAKDLPFEVPVLGADVEDAGEVDYLFWVGCAGAFEDRAKKTTRAVAELLHTAGVSFAVLGDGEKCTGDSARRAGNEFLYQMLATENIEVLNEMQARKIVVTCAHCFNTIKNEYPQMGGRYEVLHHTQLLNRLVRERKLVPVARPSEAPGLSTAKNPASTASTVTYHDPCYLGRHNQVYAPPRELIGALPGVTLTEMPRNSERSFCCGAGGSRMWMEENLGSRINVNRTNEALGTGAQRIAVACPFCRVMLTDGLVERQSEGLFEDVEVVDIAQMLLAAVKRGEE
ncbi:MAG TPA: (Fe-S)-binding protein [Tetrasphaera sp.]|uniref:(Fe-S)-binding protein n=1 Tax=Nostocoides sp. TaxID=1917966 RepID=UPI002CE73E9F|nr:(Fe-S)-binding protein [Tetrasphaera sp.]HNQ07149.1 (Fe-S)-binding protein [Tetrasphaera sp.]